MDSKFQFLGINYCFPKMCKVVNDSLEGMIEKYNEVMAKLVKIKDDDKFKVNSELNSHVEFVLEKYIDLTMLTKVYAHDCIKKLQKSIYAERYNDILKVIERDLDRQGDMIATLNKHIEKIENNADMDKRIIDAVIGHDIMLVKFSLKTLDMQKEFINGPAKEHELTI